MVQPFEHAGEQRGAALRDDACASPERVTNGARGRHWSGDGTSERDTRSQPRDSSTAPITSTVDGAPRGTEDRGSVSSWRDDLAARIDALKARQAAADAEWTPRIDEATRICLAHRPTPDAPLPSLAGLRLALAGRLQGTLALADGAPIAGLGDKLCRQLHTAAGAWLRSLPCSAPSPAAELLRRTRRRRRPPRSRQARTRLPPRRQARRTSCAR
jgi:hypothetical protein